jgi:hypothetical protein
MTFDADQAFGIFDCEFPRLPGRRGGDRRW